MLLSAGAALYHRDAHGVRWLLLRAYRNWDFPKGHVEDGETPLEAALREVREETSLVDLVLPAAAPFVETAPYARGKVARYYLAESRSLEVKLGPNPLGVHEHHEFRWLPYGAARARLVPRVQTVLDWAASQVEAVSRGPASRS